MKEQKKYKWSRLDNASKIFPSTMNARDTKVFRLSCFLKDEVDRKILEEAIEPTLQSFLIYRSVLRRGVFWYYLEESDLMPMVEEEHLSLCAPLYLKESRDLLFRVLYYKNRISVEIFHALSDGAGAIWFFETLLFHYLTKRYADFFTEDFLTLLPKAAISQKMDDSFEKTYDKTSAVKGEKQSTKKKSKVYRFKGTKVEENRTKLIEGTMSTKRILALAHDYNTTMTIFLTSLYFYVILQERPKKMSHHEIVLQVPVNLRPFFASSTARNFFAAMNITLEPKETEWTLEDIIKTVELQFQREMSLPHIKEHVDHLMALEKNPLARLIPLPLKDLTLKIANGIKDRAITSSISNVGRISMHKEFRPFIEKFSVFVSARRPQIVLCSYEDQLVISFTSPFHDTELQRLFFSFLTDKGIDVIISGNL